MVLHKSTEVISGCKLSYKRGTGWRLPRWSGRVRAEGRYLVEDQFDPYVWCRCTVICRVPYQNKDTPRPTPVSIIVWVPHARLYRWTLIKDGIASNTACFRACRGRLRPIISVILGMPSADLEDSPGSWFRLPWCPCCRLLTLCLYDDCRYLLRLQTVTIQPASMMKQFFQYQSSLRSAKNAVLSKT